MRRPHTPFSWTAAILLAAAVSVSSASAQSAATLPAPSGQVITLEGDQGISINSFIGADTFYRAGVFGQGTVVANVEAGLVWNGHETTSTVQDYYTAPGAAGEFDMHATWVGSVLASYNPNADPNNYPYYQLGIAPLTQLSSGAIATNWTDAESFNVTYKTVYSAYNHYFTRTTTHNIDFGGFSIGITGPTDVINSSWGFTDPTGADPITKAIAGFARANPLTTMVAAAGNATTPTNLTNNVGGPASGFNVISVGAVGNGTNDFTTIADFSSRGPQDYYDPVHGLIPGVRAPVDIVAPGTTLVAAFYGGQTGGNGATLANTQADPSSGANNYYTLGLAGTSFAAPIVSGGVSLLKSASYLTGLGDSSRDTRVIKAVLMNSATKLPGWDNGQHVDANGTIVTTQALDWSQGAGMLNLDRAFKQYLSGTQDVPGNGGGAIANTGWDFGSIAMSSTPGIIAHNDYPFTLTLQSGSTLDVTLSWFRNFGLPFFTDNADPDQQTLDTQDLGFANLALEIWNFDFTKLYATSDSLYNDTQELEFTLPDTGEYEIRVTYPSQMYGTPVEESYGLAWDVVPEPGTGGLVLIALAALCGWSRRPIRMLMLLALAISPALLHAQPAPSKEAYDKAMSELAAAKDPYTRWCALNHAAKESFNQGHDAEAKALAEEMETLAPAYKNDWNYGNAIQDFNIVLGRLALKAGDIDTARDRLLAAGRSKGSPQMNSFGPNLSLASDLLAKGDKAIVLEYLELVRKFWKLEHGKLDQWKKDIEENRVPDFGANLVY